MAENPPPAWNLERRQGYFDWAKEVIDRLGTHESLEAVFDNAYANRPNENHQGLILLTVDLTETDMLDKLANIGKSGFYWLALALIALSFEAVALFYQYVLEVMPCVLCIQVRLWMMALIMVALLVLLLRRLSFMSVAGHLLTVVIAAGLLERSYQLLGTERGFVFGDCGFDLGLPDWFSPDKWFPALFEVQASCGYTPELLFGITMAEVLIVFSVVFMLVSLAMTVAAIARPR